MTENICVEKNIQLVVWSHFLVCSNYQVPYKSPCRKLWLIRLWQWSRHGRFHAIWSHLVYWVKYCRWSCPSWGNSEKCIEMQIFRQVENQGWSACLLACRRRDLGSGRYSIIIKVGTYYSVRKEVGMNRLSKCVVSYQYDTTWHMCQKNNTTQHNTDNTHKKYFFFVL